MGNKELLPEVIFARGEANDDMDGDPWTYWDVGDKPEDIARTDRVKRVGVYRLEKIVNVGAQVIVTDLNEPIPEKGE